MAVTSGSIKKEIDYLEQSILNLQQKILDVRSDIENKKAELEKVLQYENRPEEQKELTRSLFTVGSTVQMMDDFESLTPEGYYKYERLILEDAIYEYSSYYAFVIERRNERDYVGDTTMTELKKGESFELNLYAREAIERHFKRRKKKKDKPGTMILFKKPYHLRAQNSGNRTGYGNYYEGYDLVIPGTLYGETTDYLVVGVVAQRF
jgi:hypothetical protein